MVIDDSHQVTIGENSALKHNFWIESRIIRYFYDDWDCLSNSKTNHTIIVSWMSLNIQDRIDPKILHYALPLMDWFHDDES